MLLLIFAVLFHVSRSTLCLSCTQDSTPRFKTDEEQSVHLYAHTRGRDTTKRPHRKHTRRWEDITTDL
jgi:hypothetical protein